MLDIDKLIPDYMEFTDANCNRCAMNEWGEDENEAPAPGCDVTGRSTIACAVH